MRFLVTAGPTREHWDDVRFLSNAATGRLGIALAVQAAEAGHEAVLVLGPTHLPQPERSGVQVVRVVSALDMLAAAREAWPDADAVVATAAVCDWRPATRSPGKGAKSAVDTGPGGEVALPLLRNPDILATLTEDKGERVAVGFALQVQDALAHARRKLCEKRLDAIVLDDPSAMGAASADFRIVVRERGGVRVADASGSKTELAARLVRLVERLR